MSDKLEKQILDAWRTNAEPWIAAVEQAGIRGRDSLTARAIVAAVRDHTPSGGAILDAGCGEGWLVREMEDLGYSATGTDATAALIEHARHLGSGRYYTLEYDQLETVELGRFDCVVSNFALLGNTSVSALLRALPKLLAPGAVCIVQTLHPVAGFQGPEYRDGWKPGTWAGLPGDFKQPAPWYFRTLASWLDLFAAAGLGLKEIREPAAAESPPQSIIFVLESRLQARSPGNQIRYEAGGSS